jgi:predicted amidohydrolase YtcJ
MKALGVGVNLFANHVYYWGETHRTQTAGPGRARSLDAGATAQRIGVPFSFHSDAPVTPLNPLFTMWCAVNRLTSQGRVLGPQERISGHDALRAMTINAAILLKTDRDTGSLEVGKFADCTVLSDDPTTCEPHAIKDIRVLGTMLAGRDQPNP